MKREIRGGGVGRTAVTAVLALVGALCAAAETMPYYARLDHPDGPQVRDGLHDLMFSLWTDWAGGELVWEERHDDARVESGGLHAVLGRSTPLPSELDGLWLELVVGGEALTPRTSVATLESDLEVDGRVTAQSVEIGADNFLFPQPHGLDLWAVGPLKLLAGIPSHPDNPYVVGLIVEEGFYVDPSNLSVLTRLVAGRDANLNDGTGYLVIGDEDQSNLVLDNNEIQARDDNSTAILYLQHSGGDVYVNGSVAHMSDAKLKHEVEDLDAGLAEALALRPVSFEWKNRPDGRRHFGLIAQDVRETFDELIYEDEDGLLGVAYDELVPVLIKALQEQQDEIEALRARFAALEERVKKGL